MARAEDKHGFTSAYSPMGIMREHSQDCPASHEATNDLEDMGTASGCGCFGRFCCFGWKWNQTDQENRYLLQRQNQNKNADSWLVDKFKELKEFSEVVAGPKWKNFIRKIGKCCNPKRSSRTQWTYSPQSYALNFDDGVQELNPLFMTRFSASGSDQQRRGSSTP